MSKLYPCAFYSRKLNAAESNYDVGDRELLVMKAEFEELRYWLEGANCPFTVLTAQKNLEYLRTAKRLNPRQARWSLFFTRFNFTVSYRPGSKNTATIHLLQNRFWWNRLKDTTSFVQKCQIHNINKTPKQLPAGLLQPLPIPQQPWSHIAIDFITDLPESDGNTVILTIIDRFSKACHLIPLPKLPTAVQTAELLCNWVFHLYGLPEDIMSDCGPQFTSCLWAEFFKALDINVSLTSGYHPQANGQVERLNQELTCFLRSYCIQNQTFWARFLMWAEYAKNSVLKPATGLTPFKCILGFQPLLFPWSGAPSDVPAVNNWLNQSEATWNQAQSSATCNPSSKGSSRSTKTFRSRLQARSMGLAIHPRLTPPSSMQKAESKVRGSISNNTPNYTSFIPSSIAQYLPYFSHLSCFPSQARC
uniref:Integrase catalytic domain-containing protein n=1 Tax=Cyprinus carpio TaxID=7962 RepID=A0A8C1WJF3_CYPCA